MANFFFFNFLDYINNNLMRSLYLTGIFNINNHIKHVEFFGNEIEITYKDNCQKRFYFNKIDNKEDITFARKVSCKIDEILEVGQNLYESEVNQSFLESEVSEANENSSESKANQNPVKAKQISTLMKVKQITTQAKAMQIRIPMKVKQF